MIPVFMKHIKPKYQGELREARALKAAKNVYKFVFTTPPTPFRPFSFFGTSPVSRL
jgi:hypothetical protein